MARLSIVSLSGETVFHVAQLSHLIFPQWRISSRLFRERFGSDGRLSARRNSHGRSPENLPTLESP